MNFLTSITVLQPLCCSVNDLKWAYQGLCVEFHHGPTMDWWEGEVENWSIFQKWLGSMYNMQVTCFKINPVLNISFWSDSKSKSILHQSENVKDGDMHTCSCFTSFLFCEKMMGGREFPLLRLLWSYCDNVHFLSVTDSVLFLCLPLAGISL